MAKTEVENILQEIGAKPSISEEHGLELISPSDLSVFCPGISTGGIAEIRMASSCPDRRVVATTIDPKGHEFALANVNELGLGEQIEIKLEDLTKEFPYNPDSFDFIYARLVLHYLSYQDLGAVLSRFRQAIKPSGRLFVVVRSEKNVAGRGLPYDPETRFTREPWGARYFHTPESITNHLIEAGFEIVSLDEYQEQLYVDFMRTKVAPVKDHVIEVLAV